MYLLNFIVKSCIFFQNEDEKNISSTVDRECLLFTLLKVKDGCKHELSSHFVRLPVVPKCGSGVYYDPQLVFSLR